MSGRSIGELRAKHRALVYESCSIDQGSSELRITWRLRLEPDIEFRPSVTIPVAGSLDSGSLETLAFNLGLMETISYWKAACPPVLRVEAGPLSAEQIAWWHDLYLNGLGEFFYENDVDFAADGFLTIEADRTGTSPVHTSESAAGTLLLLGGGKDSAVAADVLGALEGRMETLTLNRIAAADRIAMFGENERRLVVDRVIDRSLLELNASGYLNGHTPFSAYLAFLGTLVAALSDLRDVIVSNERSASTPQAIFHGQPINHQYSKSVRFERRFREYASRHLSRDVRYFSFLRPLDDLRVAELFASMPRYHAAFRSCNVGQKSDSWCGNCAKCAFVYLSLRPFLDRANVDAIFGCDVLQSPRIEQHLRELLGLGEHVPFECVGSIDESRLALRLILAQTRAAEGTVPATLARLESELDASGDRTTAADWPAARNHWDADNFVPDEHARLLDRALGRAP